MDPVRFLVECSSHVAGELKDSLRQEGIEVSEPYTRQNTADSLDAPIGGIDFESIVKTITVILSTSTAVVVFADKLLDIKRKLKPDKQRPIKIRDARTRKVVIELSGDIDEKRLKDLLSR